MNEKIWDYSNLCELTGSSEKSHRIISSFDIPTLGHIIYSFICWLLNKGLNVGTWKTMFRNPSCAYTDPRASSWHLRRGEGAFYQAWMQKDGTTRPLLFSQWRAPELVQSSKHNNKSAYMLAVKFNVATRLPPKFSLTLTQSPQSQNYVTYLF